MLCSNIRGSTFKGFPVIDAYTRQDVCSVYKRIYVGHSLEPGIDVFYHVIERILYIYYESNGSRDHFPSLNFDTLPHLSKDR